MFVEFLTFLTNFANFYLNVYQFLTIGTKNLPYETKKIYSLLIY